MHPSSPCEIDRDLGELRPLREFDSSVLQVAAASNLPVSQIDYSTNFTLLDENNTQKTGNLLSLKYEEVVYIQQEFATKVNNINPFHVVAYTGEIKLNPSVDNWINTEKLKMLSAILLVLRSLTIKLLQTSLLLEVALLVDLQR